MAYKLLPSEASLKSLGRLVPLKIKTLCQSHAFQDIMNRDADMAQTKSMIWARKYGQMGPVLLSEDYFKVIEDYHIGFLMGRAHPHTDMEKLSFITDFATWLFIYDDIIEKCKDRDLIKRWHKRTLQIIDGDTATPQDEGLMRGLSDIMDRLKPFCTPAWKARFSQDVRDYTEATFWEMENRKQMKYPTVRDYKENRPFSSGTIVMFDFIEIVEGIELSQEVFKRLDFTIVRNAGVDIVNFANDIASAPKEVAGDLHNLVFVYKNALNIDYEEALDLATRDLKRALYKLEVFSTKYSGPCEKEVLKYFTGVRTWDDANFLWSIKDSIRYTQFWSS